MVKYVIAIFIVAGFTSRCFGAATAQTNSIPVVKTNQPPRWESSLALGLTATAGNSDSVLGTGKFQTHRKTPENEWTFGLDGAYGKADSVKNNETLHSFGQYNHLFSENWYGYARVEGLHDGVANVTYRLSLSPGMGYYFIKNKQTSLAAEAGPGFIFEKLDGERHNYASMRLAERFERKINDHARIWQNVEIIPQITHPANYLINAEIGVETTLTRTLSLQTYVQDNFANEPAPERKNNDVKLVSGVVYKF